MLDLRPVAMDLPVEVETKDTSVVVGQLGGAPGLPIDLQVVRALGEATSGGWLMHERTTYFPLACYWSSVDEMRTFLASHWRRRHERLPESCFLEARRVMKALCAPARLCVRHVLILSRYRKPARGERAELPAP